MSVAERLHRGVDNMGRRREIRLSDPEIDDIAAFAGEFVGARQNGKRVLLADAAETVDGLH